MKLKLISTLVLCSSLLFGVNKSNAQLLHQVTQVYDDAAIKALPEYTPLIPAPGADKLLVLVRGVAILDNAAGAYTNLTPNAQMTLAYEPGYPFANWVRIYPFGIPHSGTVLPFSAEGEVNESVFGFQVIGTVVWEGINQTVWFGMDNIDGDLTGGNSANTLRITVVYMVYNTTTGLFE